MAEVLIQKPSRIHNLSYLLLGYYVSKLVTLDLDLSFEQEIAFIATFGSFIGALIYYVRPVERCITGYFRLTKKNRSYPQQPFDEFMFPVFRSEVVYSPYLRDERAIINGAFFLAIGLLSSSRLLESFGLSHLYWYLQICTVSLISVGLWEIYNLLKRKMPIVVRLYDYYNVSGHTPELKRAIQGKDWSEADKIIEREPGLIEPYLDVHPLDPVRGLCLKCEKITDAGFCVECGWQIVKLCSNCKNHLVRNGDTTYPRYCRYCGEKIEVTKTKEAS